MPKTKKIHWSQTPEGKKRLSRAQKLRWKHLRAEQAHPPVRKARKSPRKKVSTTVVGGEFLQKAIDDASAEIEKRLRETLRTEANDFLWTTAGGQQISPREMSEEHLRNTISMLQRKLVHSFGTAMWMADTHKQVKALDAMLDEAKRRTIRV